MMNTQSFSHNESTDLECGCGEGRNGADVNNDKAADESSAKRFCQKKLIVKLESKRDGVAMVRPKRILKVLAAFVLCGITTALVLFLNSEGGKEQSPLRWKITALMVVTFGYWAVNFATFAISWPIKRRLRTRRYAVYLIHGLKGSVDVTLYLCWVLVGTHYWILPKLNIWTIPDSQVTRFLGALCISSFLCLLKNLYCLMLEAELRYIKLFDRTWYSLLFLQAWNMAVADDDSYQQQQVRPSCFSLHDILSIERDTVPIWVLRQLSKEFWFQSPSILNNWFHEIEIDDVRNEFLLISEATKRFARIKSRVQEGEDLQKSKEAITLDDVVAIYPKDGTYDSCGMRMIRQALTIDDDEDVENNYAKADDVKPVKISRTASGRVYIHPPAARTLKIISLERFCSLSVKGCKTCWYLKQSLTGSQQMFSKLNRILNAFLLVVVLFGWLLLSRIISTGQIALLFSPLLAASFIFGDSLKNIFQGIMFAFIMHPFNVGDRVTIHEAQMRVTNLNLLTSTFMKYDTGEEVVIPNSTLMTTQIINAGEEVIVPNLRDSVEFNVDPQFSSVDIQDLEAKILMFMDHTTGHYDPKVVTSEIGEDFRKMKVFFSYKDPTLPAEHKALRRVRVLSIIVKLLKDMEMNIQECPPSYTLEIILHRALRMEDFDAIEAQIMRGLEKRYRLHSRVVIVKLANSINKMDTEERHINTDSNRFLSTIKMDLHLRDSPYTKKEAVEEKMKNESQNRCDPQLNLADIVKRVKENIKLVADVKIYRPHEDPESN